MTGIIPIRNRLAYPAGVAPGFDPMHVASRSKPVLSVVGIGDSLVNILTSKRADSSTGTPVNKTNGILGPGINFVGGNLQSFSSIPSIIGAAGSADSGVNKTIAAIFVAGNAGSPRSLVSTENIGQNTCMWITSSNFLEVRNSSDTSTGMAVTVGVPYFAAFGSNVGGLGFDHAILKRLDTGQVQTAIIAFSGNHASNSPIDIGNRSGGSDLPLGGPVAAAMFGNVAISLTELKVWAEDPWSFWYPNINDVGIHSLSSSSSRTPVFDTVTRVYPL